MKTLGLIGGMTPPSTALYYTQINKIVNLARGGSTSAPLIIHSLDHARMHRLFESGDWAGVASVFTAAARHMRDAGADSVAIGCNIGHRVAAEVARDSGLEVLHIADDTARAVAAAGAKRVGLLATLPAMEEGYISDRLREKVGGLGGGALEVLVPEESEVRAGIHRAIITELGRGVHSDETRAFMKRAVDELVARGAEGIVLACTDLQFVIRQEDFDMPLFDTLELHAKGLAEWILSDEE